MRFTFAIASQHSALDPPGRLNAGGSIKGFAILTRRGVRTNLGIMENSLFGVFRSQSVGQATK